MLCISIPLFISIKNPHIFFTPFDTHFSHSSTRSQPTPFPPALPLPPAPIATSSNFNWIFVVGSTRSWPDRAAGVAAAVTSARRAEHQSGISIWISFGCVCECECECRNECVCVVRAVCASPRRWRLASKAAPGQTTPAPAREPQHVQPSGRAEIGGHVVVRAQRRRRRLQRLQWAMQCNGTVVAAYKLHNANPESETQSQREREREREGWTNRRELQAEQGG